MSCGCSSCVDAVFPCGCGNSSCDSCATTNCDQILYVGPKLDCSDVETGDNLCVALQKLDYAICHPPGFTVTASNGLYKNVLLNDIRLGGLLTEATLITASASNTLAIGGLVSDPNPNFIISQTSIGVLRKTSTTSLINTILSNLNVNNGVVNNGGTIQLGGPLIQSTTIATSPSTTFSITGLSNNPSATSVVSINPSTGLLTTTTFQSILSTLLFNNGLTRTGNLTQLGGPLVQATTITTDAVNTLSITGLVTDSSPAYIISETAGGILRKTSYSALLPITADNGLNMSTATNVQLGGTLVKDTTVELAGYDINIIDSTTPNVDSKIKFKGKTLDGYFEYMTLGNNVVPTGKWGIAVGLSNTITQTYGIGMGVNNNITGIASYAIGSTNTVARNFCGALGVQVNNQGYISHGIGYGLEIPSGNTGTIQVGNFNDVNAADYTNLFDDTTFPRFSAASGLQIGDDPALILNAFHVFQNGYIKSKDGHDARTGERGTFLPQWNSEGWDRTSPVGGDFVEGRKYAIVNYNAGDDFSNLAVAVLWGQMNQQYCVFIADVTDAPNDWTNGSRLINVGRPASPLLGEMGFNLDDNKIEYWNGTTWVQLA